MVYLKSTTNNNMKKFIGQAGKIRNNNGRLEFISAVTNTWLFRTSEMKETSRNCIAGEYKCITQNSEYIFGFEVR